ncbi:hypothetical protein E0E50_03620 [Azotobacter chroococcum subsp. isscasi]|uniref:hypothetical protein n=1 Tax=Azotobacter chroococcum TaxID=353 RepID=UPI00103A8D3C|nr:hypothetical protein [Azotobacter chroococcum]TBW12525.1 hypothetical protein E0E50_03620 [Azotobacter chroococcum subsp. isscasi]
MTAGLAWRAAADVLDSTGKFIVALQNDFRKLFFAMQNFMDLKAIRLENKNTHARLRKITLKTPQN